MELKKNPLICPISRIAENEVPVRKHFFKLHMVLNEKKTQEIIYLCLHDLYHLFKKN